MKYVRVYADTTGESHYEDTAAEMFPQHVTPPAPPSSFSAVRSATGVAFAHFPAGWEGDWHPAPRRQYFVVLTGECESETSDGDRRSHSAGSVVLLEDTTGKGHRARVVGDGEVLAMVVQLPD